MSPAGETDAVRLTTPLKPWRPVTVMVEVPVPMVVDIVREVGLAVTVKSWTVTVTVAV